MSDDQYHIMRMNGMSPSGLPIPEPPGESELPSSTGSVIPRRPWLLSKQYSMTFVLSQDNEIIIGDRACKALPEDVLKFIIAAVNAYPSNEGFL